MKVTKLLPPKIIDFVDNSNIIKDHFFLRGNFLLAKNDLRCLSRKIYEYGRL